MPFYVPPESPEDRLFVFEETTRFVAAEQTAGRAAPIKAATLAGVTAFTAVFKPRVAALTGTLGTRAREVEEATTAKATLEEAVRDYLEVLKRRTRRKRHNIAVLVNHGLPASGDIPALGSWAELKQVATALIAGDALSAPAYGAMQNPSVAELQAALTAAQDEHEDVAPADSAVQAAQSALAAQAETAAFWVSEIRYDALDTARRADDASQRRLLRRLGYRFKTLPGEPPEDPTDQLNPAPTPPPTP